MQLIYSDRNQINVCLGPGVGTDVWEKFQRDMRKLLTGLDMFIILIVVIVSQIHTYVKINQILHFKYVQGNSCQLYFNKVIFFLNLHFIISKG